MDKDKILITILDGVDSPISGFPISEENPPFYGYSRGYCSDLSIAEKLTLVYNNGEKEAVTVESLDTSATENPLTGMLDVTIKLQLKKEDQ